MTEFQLDCVIEGLNKLAELTIGTESLLNSMDCPLIANEQRRARVVFIAAADLALQIARVPD